MALYRSARRVGLTVRSSVDCLVAACALRHDLEVLHRDRDYAALNALWPSFWEAGKLPARTTVGVTALAVGALVEIDLVAKRP